MSRTIRSIVLSILAASACGGEPEQELPDAAVPTIHECTTHVVCSGFHADLDRQLCGTTEDVELSIVRWAPECQDELRRAGCTSWSCWGECTPTDDPCGSAPSDESMPSEGGGKGLEPATHQQ